MKRLRNIVSQTIRFLVIWSVAVLVIAVLQSTFYTLAPRSRYFTYFEIAPLRAEVGKPLVFKVDREVNYTFPFKFSDTLHCGKDKNSLLKVRARESVGILEDTVEREENFAEKKRGFTYEGYIPEREEVCELRSRIDMELPNSVVKTQKITTDVFEVKEKGE